MNSPLRFNFWLNVALSSGAILGFASSVNALTINGFNGSYASSNWTLTNDNADGTVDTSNATAGSIVLTGGDNGSVLYGETVWSILINSGMEGFIGFHWSYSSVDGPGYDGAGYSINSNPVFFADTDGQSGSFFQEVNPGDTFGFVVATADNQYGPGVLTVTNFSVVPWETDILPMIGSVIFLGAGVLVKRQSVKAKKVNL